MLDREQGGRLFRLLWVMNVRQVIEEPKDTWTAPWEGLREWEQKVSLHIYEQLQGTLVASPDYALALSREDGGRLVREEWVRAIRLFVLAPKPSYLLPWGAMQEWEQEADRSIFEHVRAAVVPAELANRSGNDALWLAGQAINNVYRIALAGPYTGAAESKAIQKAAALQVAELFTAPIVESIRERQEKVDGGSEEAKKYQAAYEVAHGFLFQIRVDLQDPKQVANSEWIALLNGWYAQGPSQEFLEQFRKSEGDRRLF